MKKITILFLIVFTLSSWACPSYELASKSAEELQAEFDELKQKIQSDFSILLKTYGSHSLPEFKNLVANWMYLYTRYECWVDITENNTAKAPTDKTREWLEKIKTISVSLGKAISLFSQRDYIESRNIVIESHIDFKTLITGTFFNKESEIFNNLADFVHNKNYVKLRNYYKENSSEIEYMINYLKENAGKYNIGEYYNVVSSFFKKLAPVIDNREKFEYTVEELKKEHDVYSVYRHNNISSIKKMWAEVK